MPPKMICARCMAVFLDTRDLRCQQCGGACYDFSNDDDFLACEAARIRQERRDAGLEGLVGDLAGVVINTELENQQAAAAELLRYTGCRAVDAFEDAEARTCVLTCDGSADILVRARHRPGPFPDVASRPKARHLPNTRLETFVFETSDLDRYVAIQRDRGVSFMTDEIVEADGFSFIQTIPSSFTELSLGFIQWHGARACYRTAGSEAVDLSLAKPALPVLRNIGRLDHAATRVEARNRDPAIIEFMTLTNYDFDFSIYVKVFNSITNVARLSSEAFAMVFTSGIRPFEDEESAGPTEKFVYNYGPRVHHLAFHTEEIEATFEHLAQDGMAFLLELVGSPEEGLKQTFSEPSRYTLLVNEYIHRYGDFDGFFTHSNVTRLTGATGKQ